MVNGGISAESECDTDIGGQTRTELKIANEDQEAIGII